MCRDVIRVLMLRTLPNRWQDRLRLHRRRLPRHDRIHRPGHHPRGGVQKIVRRLHRQVLRVEPRLVLGQLRVLLVLEQDREPELVPGVGQDLLALPAADHVGDPLDLPDGVLEGLDPRAGEVVPAQVQELDVRDGVDDAQHGVHAVVGEGVAGQAHGGDLVHAAEGRQQAQQLRHGLVGKIQPVQMQVTEPGIKRVGHELHQRPHLEPLVHLGLLEQRQILLAQRLNQPVGPGQVVEVLVRLGLRGVQELQEVGHLLHQHRHGVLPLLCGVDELVDLQALHQVGLIGLDEDRLGPPGLVQHVLALDVVHLRGHRGSCGLQGAELVLHADEGLVQLLAVQGGLPDLLVGALDLLLQRGLVLLLPVHARGQVRVLGLQRHRPVLELLQPRLRVVLSLLRQLQRVLQLPVLLLQQVRHLQRRSRVTLRYLPGIHFQRQARLH
mmetsp:Transcript_12776/g.31795  ORF Transcript_12776/g.31795 Transcript_12776/m.31795 type:complete len:439 (+) Transcript_12776:108-1424(+)